MAYFSTDPGGLGEFGCGADCSCKSCRSASNIGEVYEKEEIAPPAPAKPPATPKMGGWIAEPALPRPRVSAMPGQRRKPPFEVLTGYAPGQWRLSPAQLARIQRLAEHVVRAWTTASPVTGIRLIGFAEAAEPEALCKGPVQRAQLLVMRSAGRIPAFCAGFTLVPRTVARRQDLAELCDGQRSSYGSDSVDHFHFHRNHCQSDSG